MIKLIKLNESEYMGDRPRRIAKQINVYYVFDDSVGIHLCELTPTYELHPVACAVIPYDDEAFDEESHVAEELADLEQDWLSESDVTYMHCSAIVNPKQHDTPFDDIEEAVEYYRCNQPYF